MISCNDLKNLQIKLFFHQQEIFKRFNMGQNDKTMSMKWPNQANQISILMQFIIYFQSHQNSLLCIKKKHDCLAFGSSQSLYSMVPLFEVSIFEESHVSIMYAQQFATIVIVDVVPLSSKDGLFIEIEYISSGRLDDALWCNHFRRKKTTTSLNGI